MRRVLVFAEHAPQHVGNLTERGALLDRIDAMGGTLPAIESGFIQRQIQDAAFEAQKRIDAGEDVVVGVNRYVEGVDAASGEGKAEAVSHIDVFRIDPAIEAQQIARLQALRVTRGGDWKIALAAVGEAARGTANLVPPIVTAVEQRATLGEIADVLRGVFGEYRDTSHA